MEFSKLKQRAAELKEKAGQLEEVAAGKIGEALGKFNEMVPTIKALGLAVEEVKVSMGIMPKVRARLTGSVEAIDPGTIQDLISKNQEKEFLLAVLKGLQAASYMKEELAGVAFKGLAVDLNITVPPEVSVALLE